MTGRSRIALAWLALLFAGAAGSVWSSRQADPIYENTALREVLYIPSPRTVKALSLGYTGLMADIYWTRVVQYFGNKHLQRPDSYKLLEPLLDITTTLDPHLEVAYQFGGFFLAQDPPEGAGTPDAAIALVRKGIAANPEKWRLYYNLGFIYWMEKHDHRSASEAFDAGSRVPGALPWMKVMAAAMAQGANDPSTARTLWTEILKDSKIQNIEWNARLRLKCLDSDEMVTILQRRVDYYRERTGRTPDFHQLAAAGLIRRIPVDPAGNPYEINEYGEVVVADLHELPFVTKGLPHGQRAQVVGTTLAVRPPPTPTPTAPPSPAPANSAK